MPSSLEYLCFYPFGERSDRENRRFSRCSARPKGEERGALPVGRRGGECQWFRRGAEGRMNKRTDVLPAAHGRQGGRSTVPLQREGRASGRQAEGRDRPGSGKGACETAGRVLPKDGQGARVSRTNGKGTCKPRDRKSKGRSGGLAKSFSPHWRFLPCLEV